MFKLNSMVLFLYFFLIAKTWSEELSSNNNNTKQKKKVAVCITGQVDRWIPEPLVDNLIHANPDVHFSIFIHLQFANKHHNTSFNLEYGVPSPFTGLSLQKSLHELSELYSTDHSELIDFQFQQPYDFIDWQRILHRNNQPLDRISQYSDRQHIILNMYKNHIACIDTIQSYERHQSMTFEYIINAREDLYFFTPMSLKFAFFQLDNKPSCGLVTKGCIVNHGMNMRMQIARRNDGIKIFGSRIDFYSLLFHRNHQISNPETFELYQLEKEFHLENCILPVDYFPVTSARIKPSSDNNSTSKYCILEKELQSLSTSDHFSSKYSCIPSKVYKQVDQEMKCFPCKLKSPPPIPKPKDYLSFVSSLRKSISLVEPGTE